MFARVLGADIRQKAVTPANHRPADYNPTLEQDLSRCLSFDVDFEHRSVEFDLDPFDIDELELGYPDDAEDPTQVFDTDNALIDALYTRFRVFTSKPPDDMQPKALVDFRGSCTTHLPATNVRGFSQKTKAAIATRCALLFCAALPPAPITGGVLVRSLCNFLRAAPDSSDGNPKSFRGNPGCFSDRVRCAREIGDHGAVSSCRVIHADSCIGFLTIQHICNTMSHYPLVSLVIPAHFGLTRRIMSYPPPG
ncbi:hypothetical protein B0H13DRAFT_1903876 [Mycena leptocephala]|nr:hypothetical protein B0H13DRAFT_1903876 [Mycena leptocephala]